MLQTSRPVENDIVLGVARFFTLGGGSEQMRARKAKTPSN